MSDVLRIGEYQLRNLLQNRVQFFYINLSSDTESETSKHELLQSSRKVSADALSETLRQWGAAPDAPIVLICENGLKSMAAALELAQDSYINVFVFEGGTQSLES